MMTPEESGKTLVDIGAGATAIATIAGYLPAIAALFTILWTGLRIYESATVQGWIAKWQAR